MSAALRAKTIKQFQRDLNDYIIPTGILPFDLVMGGGYGVGDLIEIASPSGRGKTTLCLDICKRALEDGKRCAFIDVESGVKNAILNNMELKGFWGEEIGSKLLLLSPKTYEDLNLIFQCIVTGPPEDRYDIVIVDSFSALSAKRKEGVAPSVDQAIGIKARHEKGFLEIYKNELRDSKSTVFLINQMRVKFKKAGNTMVAFEDSTGGNACQHYCDIRLWIDSGPLMVQEENTIMGSQKTVYGCHSFIKCKKNRSTRPMIKVLMPVVFGLGISNKIFLEELLKMRGLYSVSGPQTTFKLYVKEGKKIIDSVPELEGVVAGTVKERRELIGRYISEICDFLKRNSMLELAKSGKTQSETDDQDTTEDLEDDDDNTSYAE